MENLMIFEDKNLREEMIGRIEVLDKIKQLVLLPNTEYATTQMVADYYDVDTTTIRKTLERNKDEFVSDGYFVANGKNLVCDFMSHSKIESKRGHILIDDVLKIPQGNQGVFTRRAILRVGMLLRDSYVAQEIRNYLLNVEHDAQVVAPEVINTIVEEIDKETLLAQSVGVAYATGDMVKLMEATKALEDYRLSIKNKRIEELKTENDIIITNALTITDSRKAINALVRAIANERYLNDYPSAWKELWRKVNYQLGINVRARKVSPIISCLDENEMFEVEKICRSWAVNVGLDVNKILSLKVEAV